MKNDFQKGHTRSNAKQVSAKVNGMHFFDIPSVIMDFTNETTTIIAWTNKMISLIFRHLFLKDHFISYVLLKNIPTLLIIINFDIVSEQMLTKCKIITLILTFERIATMNNISIIESHMILFLS